MTLMACSYQLHNRACRVAARYGMAASQGEHRAATTRLRLDGVEVGEAVQRLERRAVQRRQRQRVQVQQLGVRRVPLRQDQTLERDCQQRLRAQPVIGDGPAQARSAQAEMLVAYDGPPVHVSDVRAHRM